MLIDFPLCLVLFSSSNTDNKRDVSPLKHISKPNSCSPAHQPYQRQTETSRVQENHSSVPATPEQDEQKPAANGVLVQMEQDKEKEEQEEKNDESMRTETAGLLNGDMPDGSTEQCEEHSPPHTDRTGSESHIETEDSGNKTESEHRNEEGSTDHKVCVYLLLLAALARKCIKCVCVSTVHPSCH